MARETERDGQEGSDGQSSQLSIIDSIQALAARNARANLTDNHQLLLFLQSWWSRTYNRPLKDPILLSYSLEELIYEFFDKIERRKAEEEVLHSENDKIEEKKEKDVLDWAEQEEKRELEELKNKGNELKSEAAAIGQKDPTKDPDNVAWMEEQLRRGRQEFGDSFGEDVEEQF